MAMIELYNITDETVFKYRKYAKRDQNIDIDVLKRRFTALILNSLYKKQVSENKYRYKFGAFRLYVDESTKQVIDIDWKNEEHQAQPSKEQVEGLLSTYKLLGLNKQGNKMLEEVSITSESPIPTI